MNNRPFLLVCTTAVALVALLLTAGPWAEAASSNRVYVPMVSRDAPPTAVPAPTLAPAPTLTPTAAPVNPTQIPTATPTQPPAPTASPTPGGGGGGNPYT